MGTEKLEQIIQVISKGDTGFAEVLFNKPGGRKYIESIVVTVLCNLSYPKEEKEELFLAFLKILDTLEKRIERQKEGREILRQMYR